MAEIILSKFDHIINTETNAEYRVLHMQGPVAILCEMSTTKLNIMTVSVDTLIEELSTNVLIHGEPETRVFDYNKLTERQKEIYDHKIQIMNRIVEEYGPDFLGLMGKSTKPLIDKLVEEGAFKKTTIWKTTRLYLQSGLNPYSLLPHITDKRGGYGSYSYTKKTGKPSDYGITYGIPLTDDVISHFEAALNQYKSGRNMSLEKAYNWMITKYYSSPVVSETEIIYKEFALSEKPTFRQFTYFVQKHLSIEEKDIIKTSSMEVRNNRRLLLSDVMFDVLGPCDRVQMDECEVDISIVSSLREDQCVGRPIVYAMIDIYSRIILAVSIAFDNNSVIGMTNCFLNLAEDKVKFCEKYGITITSDQWPSGYLPNRVLVDRGSEYTSKEAARIFNELNVSRELVSAGSGSLKGSIEQWFHQMQSSENSSLEHSGLITKRYDSNHHKEACLTLDEFTQILITYIIQHNTTIVKDYPLDAEMIRAGISPIPALLWKYGCEKTVMPRKIQNYPQYCYSLMLPQHATVTRKGICCNGLYYLNADDNDLLTKMYEQQNTRGNFECRIDPRDVGSLYYLKDNHLEMAPLNSMKHGNTSFAGLTLSEWNTVRNWLNQKKREGLMSAAEQKRYTQQINELIISNARKNYPTSVDNMLQNRNYEKYFIQNRSSMYHQLCDYLSGLYEDVPNVIQDNAYEEDDIVMSSEPAQSTSAAISENDQMNYSKPVTTEDISKAFEEFNKRAYGF